MIIYSPHLVADSGGRTSDDLPCKLEPLLERLHTDDDDTSKFHRQGWGNNQLSKYLQSCEIES